MNECCKNCAYNVYDGAGDYYCANENSDCFGLPTSDDDSCLDFEKREDH